MTTYCGIDLSLTSTGVCVRYEDETVTRLVTSKPAKTLDQTIDRLRYLTETVTGLVPRYAHVAVEGPSYGSTTGHQHDRSGLWWLVVDALNRQRATIVSVPPKTRAMYATGNGSAGKDAVLAAMIRKHPLLPINDNNVADAVALCDIAARYFGHPVDDLPETHTRAMKGIRP